MMRRAWLAALALLLMITGGISPSLARAEAAPEGPAGIERCAASVVRLEVYDAAGDKIGTGSGFVAFDPAVLVTARHVIVNMDYMIATRDDGTTFRIDRALDADDAADIALCALPEDANLAPLTVAAGEPLRGDGVVAVGSQFGLVNLVTLGNVCGRWQAEGVDWILFTAPVSAGCSGGPLLNDNNEVIGMIMGTYEKGQNLNLAAPIEAVAALLGTTIIGGGPSK